MMNRALMAMLSQPKSAMVIAQRPLVRAVYTEYEFR